MEKGFGHAVFFMEEVITNLEDAGVILMPSDKVPTITQLGYKFSVISSSRLDRCLKTLEIETSEINDTFLVELCIFSGEEKIPGQWQSEVFDLEEFQELLPEIQEVLK
jgi:hypothetical protein